MKVYFVSGLGADERVFQFLTLGSIDPVFLSWITPHHRETLQNYVTRLIADQIDTSKEVRLVGISFGGIICQEIARQIPHRKTVIISSVKNVHELGVSRYLLGALRLVTFVPIQLLKFVALHTCDFLFGTRSQRESKLLHSVIRDTDWTFFKWAIVQISTWTNEMPTDRLVHIHGMSDRILPVKHIHNHIAIPGGHLIIIQKADEISAILQREFMAVH